MRAVAFALVAGGILVAGAGCVLFTGSTEGYSVVDSGPISCSSASQCDGGNICCLVLNASTTSTNGTCQTRCSQVYPQLCTTNGECGDAGSCSKVTCTVEAGDGISVPLQVCGGFAGCVAAP